MLDLRATVSRDVDDRMVIALAGDIDLASAPTFAAYIDGALDAGERRVVLDMSGVTFIDSMGLQVLVVARRRIGEGLSLRAPSHGTTLILTYSGLDQVIPIEP
jgi:anti-sigma B factor antagonist